MKKVLIVAVCLALVLTLAFTLGALGKKPTDKPNKPGKLEYVYELTFTGDVTGTKDSPVVEQCSVQGGFISSSNEDDLRPNLCLRKIFDDYAICTVFPDGRYLDLSKQRGEIRMQFFFLFEDPETGEKEKIRLNVDGGYVDKGYGEHEWLSSEFRIIFDGAYAVIAPTKGKVKILWDSENVNIKIVVASL